MIELHGWLSISATYKDEDLLQQSEIDSILQAVQDIISNSKYEIRLQHINGFSFINSLHCSNHRTQEVDTIIETYKQISSVATGSYGMIWIRDDEDKIHYNEFQVYVFKRGKCTKKDDIDFSPCIPVIEDATANSDLPQ